MKDFDDARRAQGGPPATPEQPGARPLPDTLTGAPAHAGRAADPLHGIEPAPADAPAPSRTDAAHDTAAHDAEQDARLAMAQDPAYAADDAGAEMTTPEARHAAALAGGTAARDPEAERIERMRTAREDESGPRPGESRPLHRARLLTTALPFGWKGMLAIGVLTALGGALAILSPFVASISVVAVASAAFVILGAATLWMAIAGDERVVPHRLLNGALGLLMVAFGVLAFFNPLGALLSLTILAASFFVAEGVMRAWIGFKSKDRTGWVWLVAGGALSIVLGAMLFLGLPSAAFWALGLLLGVDLLTTGASMIALSFAERRATGEEA